MAVLQVEQVSKSFNGFKAVDQVSFTVEKDHIYGLLGPNGAGKTTTIRMVMNILVPDSGSVALFGQPMSDQLKDRIGYLPEERGLFPKMKCLDELIFFGELHGMTKSDARNRALSWMEKLDIASSADQKIEELSKGMQQKIQFIATILHDPELIILDEPFSGLDPVNVNLIKDILLEFRQSGKAIIFSTHMMDAAEKLCDQILMINRGKKVLDGGLSAIQDTYGKNNVVIEYEGNGRIFDQIPIIRSCNDYGNMAEVELRDGVEPDELLKHLIGKVKIRKFETQRSSLNDIFLQLVQGDQTHE